MQPRAIREQYSTDEIRTWFLQADSDGNGSLSVNEFFRWSMANISSHFGDSALPHQSFVKTSPVRLPIEDAILLGMAALYFQLVRQRSKKILACGRVSTTRELKAH